jgi:hypothetical protein
LHLKSQSEFQGNQHPFLTPIGDKSGLAGYQAVFFAAKITAAVKTIRVFSD